MARNENSDDLWLQIAAKRLKVQIIHSDMWVADVFYYKTCYNRSVYFYTKISKENPLLNRKQTLCVTKYQASLQKKNFSFR